MRAFLIWHFQIIAAAMLYAIAGWFCAAVMQNYLAAALLFFTAGCWLMFSAVTASQAIARFNKKGEDQ